MEHMGYEIVQILPRLRCLGCIGNCRGPRGPAPRFFVPPCPPGPGEALKTNLNQMPGAKNGLDGLEVKQYLRNKSTKSKTHFSSFFHVECQSQMLLKIKKDKTCCFILQINDGTHAAFVWFWVFNHFQP